MTEIIIVFPKVKRDIAGYFKEKIYDKVKQCDGIITLLTYFETTKVVIAVDSKYKRTIKTEINLILANIIATTYKFEYLVRGFNFTLDDSINFALFVKALISFDINVDREIIFNELNKIKNKIVVDSFFNFKLTILKTKWNDLINLANDNITYLLTNEMFVELLKFLISNLDIKSKIVNVSRVQEKYLLTDDNNQILEDHFVNYCDVEDAYLLSSLIGLNPRKIIIHNIKSFKESLINFLLEIFPNRVQIQ